MEASVDDCGDAVDEGVEGYSRERDYEYSAVALMLSTQALSFYTRATLCCRGLLTITNCKQTIRKKELGVAGTTAKQPGYDERATGNSRVASAVGGQPREGARGAGDGAIPGQNGHEVKARA